MTIQSRILRRGAKAIALCLIAGSNLAHGGYFRWEPVTAPADSNATCGNGSPYRLFVNRTPLTTRTIVIFEGGGACFGQQTCKADLLHRGVPENGVLLAFNPDGIPANYMTSLFSTTPSGSLSINQSLMGFITPLSDRLGLLGKVQTQAWNIVYLPYCTGDIHVGNKVNVYTDYDPTKPRVQYHRGYINGQFAANWLATNMPRPDKLLVTGFSAGGYGAAGNYDTMRRILKPRTSALLDDGGPIFTAPAGSDAPSLPLYTRIRKEWGVDGPQGLLTELLTRYPSAGGDPNNFGSIVRMVASVYPKDRLGMATMVDDQIIPRFSYEPFYPEILATPAGPARDKLLNDRWRKELADSLNYYQSVPNIGYYVPYARDILLSHTLTGETFAGTAIPEFNIKSVTDFIDNLLDESGTPVMRAVATRPDIGHTTVGAAMKVLFDQVLALLGA